MAPPKPMLGYRPGCGMSLREGSEEDTRAEKCGKWRDGSMIRGEARDQEHGAGSQQELHNCE